MKMANAPCAKAYFSMFNKEINNDKKCLDLKE
jgi:hypothetical protein